MWDMPTSFSHPVGRLLPRSVSDCDTHDVIACCELSNSLGPVPLPPTGARSSSV